MARMLELLPAGTWVALCLFLGFAVAMAPVQAQDYSDGWSLDPDEDPLLEDDDDDEEEEGPTLYYHSLTTGQTEIYRGRDDSVSPIIESKVQRPAAPVESRVESQDEATDKEARDEGTHGKGRSHRSARSGSDEGEKAKTGSRGSGGVGTSTTSDDEEE